MRRYQSCQKQVNDKTVAGRLDDRVMYQPGEEELAEAVAILVECGAVREVER